jgi:hypothetical protein
MLQRVPLHVGRLWHAAYATSNVGFDAAMILQAESALPGEARADQAEDGGEVGAPLRSD